MPRSVRLGLLTNIPGITPKRKRGTDKVAPSMMKIKNQYGRLWVCDTVSRSMKIKLVSLLLASICLPAMAAQRDDGSHRGQEQAPRSFKLLHHNGNCPDGSPVEGILVLEHLTNTLSLTRSNCQDISPQNVAPPQVQHASATLSDADILIYRERLYLLPSSNNQTLNFCIGASGAADWPVTQATI